MKRHLGLIGVLGALVLVACARSNDGEDGATALDEQEATLVAALAANEDGSEEAWTSAAGDEPFLVEGCGFGAIVARVIERFDTDGSGELSEEERAALADEFGDPAERFELLVSAYDSDGSGALETSELDLLKADLEACCEARRTELLERFDVDGDGSLDADEREAARAALRERFGRRHAARIERFDRDGDGRLGPLERRRAGGVLRDRLAARREAIIDLFDVDQDGELDAAEREALGDHLRRCVRGEAPLPPTPEPAPDARTASD